MRTTLSRNSHARTPPTNQRRLVASTSDQSTQQNLPLNCSQSEACPCGGGCPRCETITTNLQRVLASAGRPLPREIRPDLEAEFQHDFSAVRLHDDAQAAASAQEVGARAYTVGSHIAVAGGSFDPTRESSQRLLRHELTHVRQQKHNPSTPDIRSGISILPRNHATEVEARNNSSSVKAASVTQLPTGPWLQREPVRDTPDAGPESLRQKPYVGPPPSTDAGQTQDAGVKDEQSDAGELDTSKKTSGKIDLSARDTTAGMLERLFMAEARTPLQEKSYDEADSLKCMKATGACIINRKNDAKKRWPKTISGVVKQKGQFKGFETYPEYGEAQRQHNIEVLKWANTKSKYQEACRTFVNNAKAVAAATEAETLTDPFSKAGGTYGMRTEESDSPGGGFKKVGTCGGNDFYTVT